ncbi:hypothetical protein DACRYDRAFT_103754 [Dacryopinax primogenitus]|uniref:Uncharacterized protein n=1 Tax=Dacryopinax primogenitus (strain DJM 731) TaxID=1858805 RepID=M5G4T0_DACPD|nr:uncharacterized protein DACRYDRAFT_103754 [Dacryopinax primogenitus]EJU05261.1 hypothetical protein DACRYDRAFT_103754 [Dacryopinax primogenitus]
MSLRLLPDGTSLPASLSFPKLRYLSLDTSSSSLAFLSRCPALECVKLFYYPGAVYAFGFNQFEDMCQALKRGGSNKTLRILDFAGHSWSTRLYLLAATKLTQLPLESLEVVNMNHSPLNHPPELLEDVINQLLNSVPTLRALGLLQTTPGYDPSGDDQDQWKLRSIAWEAGIVEHIWPRGPKLDYISFAGKESGIVRRLWTADIISSPHDPTKTSYQARLLQETVLCGSRFEGAHSGFPLAVDEAWAEFVD